MSLETLRKDYKTAYDAADALNSKADKTDDDRTKIDELLERMHSLKADIGRAASLESASEWAAQSQGGLPLASPTKAQDDVDVMMGGKTGDTFVNTTQNIDGTKTMLVNEYGEGLMDLRTIKAIGHPSYRKAFNLYLRQGFSYMSADDRKTLQEGLDPSGGYIVPDPVLSRLIAKEPAPTTVASRVTNITASSDSITMPRIIYTTDDIYTSGMRVTWTGEIPAAATTHRVTDPVFGQHRIPIYTAMMSIAVTNDMIEDAAFNLLSWLMGKFEETVVLLRDNMALNGNGVSQPSGILVNPNGTDNPATVVTTAASTLTWDGVHNLLYALPEQYDRNAVVVMNKTNTALALSKLADGDGRPYWTQGSTDYGLAGERINRPLMGYPVMFNAFMPNVGTNAYPILFGDLGGYYQVMRVGFSVQTLRELYAETNQVVLLGRLRLGGLVVEPWKMKIQQCST